MKIQLSSLGIADDSSILSIDKWKKIVNCDVSPNWVNEQSDQIKAIAICFLVLDKSFSVCLKFCYSWKCTEEVRAAVSSRLKIVGIDVLTKVHCFGNFIRFFPDWRCIFVSCSKWKRWGRELKIMEVEIVKFSLTCSISLKRSHNINSRVQCNIIFWEFEVLSYFLAFSE